MDVWIQILLISLGLSVFSQLLNKIMKVDPKHIKEMQTRLRELNQELNDSRGSGGSVLEFTKPPRSAQEVNAELMVLMKKMTTKQLLPMCLRCGIFWGIFALLSAIYGIYMEGVISFPFLFFGSGWVGAYVMFSLIFSFSILGLQKLYKKITHQEKPATLEMPQTSIPTTISWKERLEAAKKESQGENNPDTPPSP